MAFPTARDALYGNPPSADHQPDKAVFRQYLEGLEVLTAGGTIKGFASTVADLPASGNTLGDLRIVLTDPTVDGGVYLWDGTEWSLDATLPTIYWDDAYARLAQAWAEGTLPGGPGTKSAREYAALTEADAVATAANRAQTTLDRAAATASATAASLSEQQSQAAALLAGAPIAPAMPTDDTETAALASPFLFIAAEGVQSWTHGGTLASLTQGPHVSRVEFDDVVALKAYNGPALPVGLIIRTRKEGFAYEVVSSGEHPGTAGGDKLRVVPKAGQYEAAAFGAVNSGDTTAALSAAFRASAAENIPLVLTGAYAISGALGWDTVQASASLRLICRGDVTITYDPEGDAADAAIYIESTAAGDVSVRGGTLAIYCSDKCADGLHYRHYGVGGDAYLENVRCYNVLKTEDSSTENAGIALIGEFRDVTIKSPRVNEVDRSFSAGASSGITVSGFTGVCRIIEPDISLVAGGQSVDYDGMKVFGKLLAEATDLRAGICIIEGGDYRDNQGRHIKTQCAFTKIIRPRSYRQNIVSIVNGVDFDIQGGEGLIVDPTYDYRLDGETSPLGASFYPVGFQNGSSADTLPNASFRHIGGRMRTEVPVLRLALLSANSGAGQVSVVVDDFDVMAEGALAVAGATAITRSIVEFSASAVLSKTTKTSIAIRRVRGPLGCAPIGYTGYVSGGSPEAKLSWEATDIRNTIAPSATRPFHNLSGNPITRFEHFLVARNLGVPSAFFGATLEFDFQKLVPGCVFYCDIANNIITRAPSWGASGYALIEVLDGASNMGARATDRTCRAQVVGAAPIYTTHNGGTSWVSN